MAIIRRTTTVQDTNVSQYGNCGIDVIGINDPAKWAEISKDAADRACFCADKACKCADEAKDAADRAEDVLDKLEDLDLDNIADEAQKALEAAKESKEWAVGLNPDPAHDIATDTNNSMYWSDQSKAINADVTAKHSEVITMHGEVSTWKDEVEVDKKYVHDFTVGLNPPPSLETPTDTNNAYYYYQQVLNLAGGAIAFNGIFTPSASKEYPDKTGTSSLWIIQTSDPNGYIFTTGLMAGVTTLTGDWMLYYKDKDIYELLKVSPIREGDVPPASEDKAGIAKLATTSLVDSGTDDSTIITPSKLKYRVDKITPDSIGARPNTWTPTASDVGARPDDWLPTPSEIGARPDTWTPSASDVGAKPVDWKPATSDIPAAPTNDQPAGFGGFRYEVTGTAPNQTLKLYTVNP